MATSQSTKLEGVTHKGLGPGLAQERLHSVPADSFGNVKEDINL